MINKKKILEKVKIKLFLKSAVVVAQQLSTRLMTEWSWVRILQGAGLFFSSLSLRAVVKGRIDEVPSLTTALD